MDDSRDKAERRHNPDREERASKGSDLPVSERAEIAGPDSLNDPAKLIVELPENLRGLDTVQPPEDVSGLDEVDPPRSGISHRDAAAKQLAFFFSFALCIIFIAHLVSTMILVQHLPPTEALESLSRVFSTWIPVFSGFVASAVTYYFTQGRR